MSWFFIFLRYFITYGSVNFFFIDGPQSSIGEETPTYLMEHLATFTVAKETGIVYPADGMRRLLQLEKSNGIWSQKMQLRLDMSWVLIMDYETGVRSAFYSCGIS
jgi:epidermal growth factor receptor kinase substrate 8